MNATRRKGTAAGLIDAMTCDLVGFVYHYFASCEPLVSGGGFVTEVAVIVDASLGDTPGAARFGTVRALQQLRQQFDILSPSVDLGAYALVVIPETTMIDSSHAARLTAYSGSGSVLFISRCAQSGSNGVETLSFAGVRYVVPSLFSKTFTRPGTPLGGASGFDQFRYDRSLRLKPVGRAEVLALIVELHFESEWDRFSGHKHAPTSHLGSKWAAIVQNGNTITAAVQRLQAMGNHGAPVYREPIRGCLKRLMPRLALRARGPVHLESTIVRKRDTLVVQLISFMSTRVAEDNMGHRSSGGLDLIEDPFRSWMSRCRSVRITCPPRSRSSRPERRSNSPGKTDTCMRA